MSNIDPALADLLARSQVARVLALLDDEGEEARIVGGAVRNALFGLPVSDIDIATTALPASVQAKAGKAGLRTVPTGIEHGTVTVLIDGQPFEVTTLREDIETDGRRAKVRFGRDFSHDALRRDFTINALSLDRAGVLYDYTGGLADIAARRVRFIGDPAQRIAEDYLRILRLFRFHAQYGAGRIEARDYEAAIAGRAGLKALSRERVRQEFFKLLAAPGAVAAVFALAEGGMLDAAIGGLDRRALFARLADFSADPLLRLAALALFKAEDVERLRAGLKLTNAETRRLSDLAARLETFHGRVLSDEGEAKALLFRHGSEAYNDLFALMRAQARADFIAHADLPQRWTPPASPFDGGAVLALGVPAGPAVGRVIAEAEARWMAAGFPDEALRIEKILKEALASA